MAGSAWDALAHGVRLSTVHRARQAFAKEILDKVQFRKKPTGRPYRKLDDAQQAQRRVLASSPPPAGCCRWTVRMLSDRLGELKIVDAIRDECVRTTLQKRAEVGREGLPGDCAGDGR